jgi:MFS family permease
VTFLDVVDGSIVNVALPTIRTHLGFSVQNLQWVVSGYLITYGGFLLLGGRAGDLLGRRRLLIAGTALFAVSSLALRSRSASFSDAAASRPNAT